MADYLTMKNTNINFLNHIDNGTQRVVKNILMNEELKIELRAKLANLLEKGWTRASIARAINQASGTVEAWNRGIRSPANLHSVIVRFGELEKRKRIPKKKYYPKGSRRKSLDDGS